MRVLTRNSGRKTEKGLLKTDLPSMVCLRDGFWASLFVGRANLGLANLVVLWANVRRVNSGMATLLAGGATVFVTILFASGKCWKGKCIGALGKC